MTIYDISGLEIGNDEELTRAINKIYDKGRRIGCLIVNEKQLSFIGDSYEVYGETVQDDRGKPRSALFFDPGWNPIELRVDGDE